jgi:predicted amidophosphoribosyltransferase
MLTTLISLWIFCGIVAVMVAANKGQKDFMVLLSSIILGPVGIVLVLRRKKVKMFCPYCSESVDVEKNGCSLCGLKLEEIQRLGESTTIMQCLRCGKNGVHDAYLEDGSWGKWCPNCKMSIKRMRERSSRKGA